MFEKPGTKENKEEKQVFNLENHNKFVKEEGSNLWESLQGGVGTGFEVTAALFALASIYEFMTGHKTYDLMVPYADIAPDIIKDFVYKLSEIPLVIKSTGTLPLMLAGQWLKEKIESQ